MSGEAGDYEKEYMELTDKSLMLFGKHKDTELANVPADYLLWIYDNYDLNQNLKDYIEDNLERLKLEVRGS